MPRPAPSRLLGALLLALPLALAAQSEQDSGKPKDPNRAVATVDGVPITITEVSTAVNRKLPLQSFHGSVDPAKLRKVSRETLQQEIDRRLKLADAPRLGVKVTDGELERAVSEVVARYPSREAFEARLEQGGFSMDDVNDALRRNKLVEKAEAKVADAGRQVGVSRARAYYDANLDKFREPRRAVVREILVVVDALGRNEEAWKAAEAKAFEARRRASAGEDFAALVEEFSGAREAEKKRGGLLGAVHEGRLPAYLDKVVWTLPEGAISDPIRGFKGVYLLKIDRFLPERIVPFEETESKLREQLQAKEARQRVDAWVRMLREQARIEYLDPYFAPRE